jgi:Kef-type K+ transport systems, membrane components
MGHLPKLIEDLALILITGAITTLIFRRIRQPLVLGYIIAGFLVGPHLSITPTVADTENVETLAEIGVIFLLFSLGLEFSFKKLLRVGGAASITALFEIVFIVISGYFVGRWMNWSVMDSLFLGGMLASSSTTIIIRAFDELGVKARNFARIVFGVLVVEDIVVILLMVLLSTMSVSQQFEGMALVKTVAKLLFFLALWFITGIFLLPTFLKAAKKYLDEETLLILAIGLCLGMVVVATNVGFSAELGAFIMGSIMAETTFAEKVEHIIKPVKDLFGAVFFVSVGMLIDPGTIIEYKWPVLWVTLLTLFGKFFSTTIGALISGQPLRQSIQVGMSMAQIGEFAFIVATLGLSLGVISNFLFPVAVGASAITTFTTPYMIKFSEKMHVYVEKMLPKRWVNALGRYSSSTSKIQAESNWKQALNYYGKIIAINGTMIIAIIILSANFLMPFLRKSVGNDNLASIICFTISLAAASPFLVALMTKKSTKSAYKELWLDEKYSHGPLLILEIVRIFIGIFLIGFWADTFFSSTVAVLVVIPTSILLYYIFAQRIQRFYQRMEGRFLVNLNARELAAAGEGSVSKDVFNKNVEIQSNLAPWSAHIIDLVVHQEAAFAGKTLMELAWREKFGINIAYIKRGDKLIHAPNRYDRILPADHVGIIATDEQYQAFKPEFDAKDTHDDSSNMIADIQLQKIVVDEHTKLKGLSIRESGIRERTNGLVVGIERGDQRILNPDSTTIFEWNDIVWIVGDRRKIQELAEVKNE